MVGQLALLSLSLALGVLVLGRGAPCSAADEYRLQDCAQIRNVRKTCELWNFC